MLDNEQLTDSAFANSRDLLSAIPKTGILLYSWFTRGPMLEQCDNEQSFNDCL